MHDAKSRLEALFKRSFKEKVSNLGVTYAIAEYFGTKLSCQTSCCKRSESGVYFPESDIDFWRSRISN